MQATTWQIDEVELVNALTAGVTWPVTEVEVVLTPPTPVATKWRVAAVEVAFTHAGSNPPNADGGFDQTGIEPWPTSR